MASPGARRAREGSNDVLSQDQVGAKAGRARAHHQGTDSFPTGSRGRGPGGALIGWAESHEHVPTNHRGREVGALIAQSWTTRLQEVRWRDSFQDRGW